MASRRRSSSVAAPAARTVVALTRPSELSASATPGTSSSISAKQLNAVTASTARDDTAARSAYLRTAATARRSARVAGVCGTPSIIQGPPDPAPARQPAEPDRSDAARKRLRGPGAQPRDPGPLQGRIRPSPAAGLASWAAIRAMSSSALASRPRIFSTTLSGALARNASLPSLAVGLRLLLLGGGEVLRQPLALGRRRRSCRTGPARPRRPRPAASPWRVKPSPSGWSRSSWRMAASCGASAVPSASAGPGPSGRAGGPGRSGTGGPR